MIDKSQDTTQTQIEFTDLPKVIQEDIELILDFIVRQEGLVNLGTDDRGETQGWTSD